MENAGITEVAKITDELDLETKKKMMRISQIPWREYMRIKNYDSDVSQICTKCRREQIDKHGKITINCQGMQTFDDAIPKQIQHTFSTEEKDSINMVLNPYEWAERSIDIDTLPEKRLFRRRWYQEAMSRCTSDRKAFRCGRRTGKSYSMSMSILHAALVNKNYRVLIVAPFEVQVEEIFNYIKSFIRNINVDLGVPNGEIIKRSVASPVMTMELYNGSIIKGFTTGANGAGAVRGQPGNLLVLDEVDYMSQRDVNSILAILADRPDTKLWVSSTPAGEKILHKMSQMEEYKEFHYPSFVIPHYDDKLDAEFRRMNDEIGYVQEIMAEFGSSKNAIFQDLFLDVCMALSPTMSQVYVLAHRDEYIVSMGCDWNHDKIGTRIIVTSTSLRSGMSRIIEKVRVSKEGWTQNAAIEEIVKLNRKYRFNVMYVDEGYGISQIQSIKKIAIDNYGRLPPDHPDLMLVDIKGINFSSSIIIIDQETGDEVKKPAKQYMVENLRLVIESAGLELDKVEDAQIIKELKNYEEKNRTPSGKIIYGPSNEHIGDHDLDALMLSILGVHMEYSELFNMELAPIGPYILSKQESITKNIDKDESLLDNYALELLGKQARSEALKAKSRSISNNKLKEYKDTAPGFDGLVQQDSGRSNNSFLRAAENHGRYYMHRQRSGRALW